ncbi:MAG: LytR family transcriptional regulator [Actinobacteria bacterium]|nr:MAG: LytR family transcriptional regulator [Actinomycetota bacterium]
MSRKRRSPVVAGLASAFVPGFGQILTGAKAAGWMLVLTSATTVVLVAWGVVNTETQGLLAMITNPDLVLVLVGVNVVFGLIRLLSVTDAWRRADGKLLRFGLVALVIFTIAPHAAFAYVGLEARSTIVTVFPTEPVASPPPSFVAISSTTTTTKPPPPLAAPWTIPTSSTTTTTTLPLGAPRITFLLLGGDAGPGRKGLRTDTVMVATVDTVTGSAAIFGLPRNMAGLAFSDGTEFFGTSKGILNEAYEYGRKNADRFEGSDPGVTAVRDIVSTTIGMPIDHYLLVDMQGFAELVDTLGGVTVNPSAAFVAPLYYEHPEDYEMITFSPGVQHLDGAHALAYARSRTESNDYVRMARQRCLVASVLAAANPYRVMSGLIGILDVIERRVSTDIPSNRLPFFINFLPSIQSEQITFVGFDNDYRTDTYTRTGLQAADVPRIQETVADVLSGSWEGPVTNLDVSSEACG